MKYLFMFVILVVSQLTILGCGSNKVEVPGEGGSKLVSNNLGYLSLTGYLNNKPFSKSMPIFMDSDSCEYIRSSNTYGSIFTHKGNCKKCAERDSIQMDKIISKYLGPSPVDEHEKIKKSIDSLQGLLPK